MSSGVTSEQVASVKRHNKHNQASSSPNALVVIYKRVFPMRVSDEF